MTDLLPFVFGIIGCLSSSIFFSTPVITIYELYHNKKTVNKISGVHLFLSYLNYLMWLSIGIKDTKIDQIFWCNLGGALLNFIWCVTYLNFYSNGKKFLFFVYAFTLLDISIEFLYFESILFEEDDKGENGEYFELKMKIVKWILSICVNLFMYLTPGFNLVKLFKTKDHQMIRIISVIAGFVNSVIWFAYGIILKQVHVYVTNGIAMFICAIQIWLYYYYKKNGIANNSGSEKITNISNNNSV